MDEIEFTVGTNSSIAGNPMWFPENGTEYLQRRNPSKGGGEILETFVVWLER